MHFIPEDIENYALAHSEKEPEYLQQLSRETNQKVLQPRMLSGHFQGRFLSIISKLVQPENILEIGTYTGYSALCLAEGLKPGGKLHTIDVNEELFDLQKKYFQKSGFQDKIKQYTGIAADVLPSLNLKFDLIFIDADKPNYPLYFERTIDKLNSGGVIISDNVLWSGKVTQTPEKDDESTAALLKYNRLLAEDERLETIILPIRDGLMISRKK